MRRGYIFIGQDGSYAKERTAQGTASSMQVIDWVESLSDATVFTTPWPWKYNGNHTTHECLQYAQLLQGTEQRIVSLTEWKREESNEKEILQES